MPLSLARRWHVADAAALPPIRETDLDRILKLIPTEVLTFYAAALAVVPEVPWRYFALTLFVGCAALVPLILYLDGRSTQQPASWPQYVVRTLSFVAWANAISWPLGSWVSETAFHWARSLAVLLIPLIGALVLRDKASA